MTDTKNTRGLKGHLDKTSHAWQLKSTRLKFGRLPAVMGIVNVTPDSFSDGGKFLDPELAVEQGLKLAGEGADWTLVARARGLTVFRSLLMKKLAAFAK